MAQTNVLPAVKKWSEANAGFYKYVSAQAHAIAYPEALEAIMVQRLEDLQMATS